MFEKVQPVSFVASSKVVAVVHLIKALGIVPIACASVVVAGHLVRNIWRSFIAFFLGI